MSGGAYDYVYGYVQIFAEQLLEAEPNPENKVYTKLREKFAEEAIKFSEIMKVIEYVDSGDTNPIEGVKAILEYLEGK